MSREEESNAESAALIKQSNMEINKSSSSQCDDYSSSSDTIPLSKPVADNKLKITDLKVEPLLFLILFGSSLSGPILTNLLLIRSCEALHYPVENCTHLDSASGSALEREVQPYVARLSMYKSIAETPLPALMSLFLGSWSDKYGRRPIILFSLAGIFFQYVFLIAFSILDLPPFYIFFASCPIIVTGGNMLLYSTIFSHISDLTKGKAAIYRMTIAEGMIYLGLMVGTLVTPFIYALFPSHGFEGMFSLSCCCSLISLSYAFFFVQESVIKETRTSPLLKSILDWHLVKDVFQTCFRAQNGYKRLIFFLLIACSSFNLLITEGLTSVFYLFARNKFSWTLKDFTMYIDASFVMVVCGLALGITVSTKWLSANTEGFVACFAYLAKVIAYILSGVTSVSWCLYLSSAISALGGVAGPIGRSIVCKIVHSKDIGKAFVFSSFIDSLLPMVGATVYASLYTSTLDVFPGAIFIFSAILSAVNCFFMGLISYLILICSGLVFHDYVEESPSHDNEAEA